MVKNGILLAVALPLQSGSGIGVHIVEIGNLDPADCSLRDFEVSMDDVSCKASDFLSKRIISMVYSRDILLHYVYIVALCAGSGLMHPPRRGKSIDKRG